MRRFLVFVLALAAVAAIPCATFSAQVSADMVAETTETTGTGTVSLIAPVYGYRGFVAGVGDGNTCVYQIKAGAEWEIGLGTVTDAEPDTLSRDTVYSSSNSGSLVNFSAGTKTVIQVLSATEIMALKAKETNVPTALSIGTKTATTIAITSDGGADDVVLPEADTDNAGLLGADKWDEIVANSAARHADEPDASTTVKGIIEIADDTEALAGTDTGKAVTPAGVKIYGDSVYEPKDTNILKSTEQNAGTDITADLEEESHASEHAVSAADTVFPADPGEDKYLMWDDDPGALVWSTVAGAAHDAVTLGTFADKFLSLTSQQLDLELTDPGADRAIIWDDDPGVFAWLDYSSFLTSIPDNYLLNTGDAGTGTYDFGAADDFEVPNGANPTVDTAGQIAVDSSAAPGSGIRFYGDSAYTLAGTYSKSFVILNPVATDDYPIWCAPYAITIKHVRVQCLGGTNIVGQLTECDGEGINCAVVDDSDITATANNSIDDDGTLSNPSIDAGDYVGWKTESISGTPTSVTVTFDYIINQVN